MIEINDEESLKKENITIELFTKELNEVNQKATNLKNKIGKEIDEINKCYNIVKSQINKKFKEEHEKLIIEENDLIEKLQHEVEKTKENLEKYLSQSNEIIGNYEKINKGINLLEKEQKNIIQELTYITKINKSKNKYNYIFNELISNLKISFENEQRKVKYEKYCFNGIPILKEIKFNDISSDSFKLEWKIDNLDKIDKNKIKYKVELREVNENINEKFNQVYFDYSNTNCLISNLKPDTKYEIKICCIYNNIEGKWSEIQNIKTELIDSIILKESKKGKELLEKIYEWSGYKKMELLYRGTRDGKSCNDFHNKCDNKGPTICLYKSEKGYIFGGYSPISWTSSGNWKELNDSFIFTLTNIYDKSTKFPHIEGNDSVYHYSSHGPTFNDFYIKDNFKYELNFPRCYKDVLGKGKSIFTGDNNDSSLNIKEIEVFKLSK